jgi:hypothetical protein
MESIGDLTEVRDRTRWILVSVGAALGDLEELVESCAETDLRASIEEQRPILNELRIRLLELEAQVEKRIERTHRGRAARAELEPVLQPGQAGAFEPERPASGLRRRRLVGVAGGLAAGVLAFLMLASSLPAQQPDGADRGIPQDTTVAPPLPAPRPGMGQGGRMDQMMMRRHEMMDRHRAMVTEMDSLMSGMERMRGRTGDTELRRTLDDMMRRMQTMRDQMREMMENMMAEMGP